MKCIFFLLAVVLVLFSCKKAEDVDDSNANQNGKHEYYEEDEEVPIMFNRLMPITLTDNEKNVHDSTREFAYNYLRTCAKAAYENTLVSPFSTMALLAMTSNGAEGKTRDEIIEVIGTSNCTVADVNAYFQSMYKKLLSVDKNTKFTLANSIWVDSKFQIRNTFKEALLTNYDAEVYNIDFSKSSAADIINTWCKDKTRGRIPSIFEPQKLSGPVVIADAMYFKAKWNICFREKTIKKVFTNADKTTSSVDMMQLRCCPKYIDTGKVKILKKDYGNKAHAMYVILPSDSNGLNDFIDSFNAKSWEQMKIGMKTEYIDLELPQFEIGDDRSIKEMLTDMGIKTAFTSSANFSNISDASLYINSIKQCTKIKVNTKGTEAATVSAEDMTSAANPDKVEEPVYIPFVVDRPFAFIVEENSTGVIFFMGVINKL